MLHTCIWQIPSPGGLSRGLGHLGKRTVCFQGSGDKVVANTHYAHINYVPYLFVAFVYGKLIDQLV